MKASTPRDREPAEVALKPAIGHFPSHLRLWLVAGLVLWLDLWSKDWVFANLSAEGTRPLIRGFIDLRRSLNDGAVFGSLTGQIGLFITASVFALGFVTYLFACSAHSQRALHIALGLVLAGAFGNLYDRATSKADIISYTSRSNTEVTVIGKIVAAPEGNTDSEEAIWLGSWPDGGNPRRFRRSEVSVRNQGVVRDFLKFTPKFPSWVPWLGKRANRDIWPWVFNVADSALVCGVGILLCTSWLDRRPREPG